MKCLSCKYGDMEETKTNYFAQLNNCYIIIENVLQVKFLLWIIQQLHKAGLKLYLLERK
ncbi:hypothetical protein [Acetivibrio ethanolgignens]|uniref:hypothetical protein n=1 Tax=Acetivibrio ethanolgignens TaxID=290052 RepID=UPI0012DF9DEA|nr:hypothetical protein [Acetivibrio ethanolgignens]